MKSSLIISATCLMAAVAAAGTEKFQPVHVKTGLWRVTRTTTINGGLPPDMQAKLVHMPPEERARLEAAMKKRLGGVPDSTNFKSCVTEKDLKNQPWEDRSGCKWTVITSTQRKWKRVERSASSARNRA